LHQLITASLGRLHVLLFDGRLLDWLLGWLLGLLLGWLLGAGHVACMRMMGLKNFWAYIGFFGLRITQRDFFGLRITQRDFFWVKNYSA
jgi:hypothetical protein